jgi:hypothetical protein
MVERRILVKLFTPEICPDQGFKGTESPKMYAKYVHKHMQ